MTPNKLSIHQLRLMDRQFIYVGLAMESNTCYVEVDNLGVVSHLFTAIFSAKAESQTRD
jgi:hypothetical protein